MPRSRAPKGAEVAHQHALAWLIATRKQELDLTWDKIAERGGFSSHTIVYSLMHKERLQQTPRHETMEKLARALDVPEDVVKICAASAAGFGDFNDALRRDVENRMVLHHAAKLSPEEQEKLARMACALGGTDYPSAAARPRHVDI